MYSALGCLLQFHLLLKEGLLARVSPGHILQWRNLCTGPMLLQWHLLHSFQLWFAPMAMAARTQGPSQSLTNDLFSFQGQ